MALDIASFTVPLLVSSPVDVGRLLRELESIDATLTQAALRQQPDQLPKLSGMLQQTVDAHQIDLLQADQRKSLIACLTAMKAKSPVLHISFSADPSVSFIEKLVAWLRKEIHPQLLLTVGLQPSIGAGCIIRSTNKYFDFSLRQDFLSKRQLLLDRLGPVLTTPVSPVIATEPVAVRAAALPAGAVHTPPPATPVAAAAEPIAQGAMA